MTDGSTERRIVLDANGAAAATLSFVSGPTGAQTYTVSVPRASAPPATRSVVVSAFAPPFIGGFVAFPSTVVTGGAVTLVAFNGNYAIIVDDAGTVLTSGVTSGGNTTSGAVQRTTAYTLLVSNPAGRTVSRTVIVATL